MASYFPYMPPAVCGDVWQVWSPPIPIASYFPYFPGVGMYGMYGGLQSAVRPRSDLRDAPLRITIQFNYPNKEGREASFQTTQRWQLKPFFMLKSPIWAIK